MVAPAALLLGIACGATPTSSPPSCSEPADTRQLEGQGQRALPDQDADPQALAPNDSEGSDEDAGSDDPPAAALTHGPLLGAVTDRSIKIWARADDEGELSVHFWPEDAPEMVRAIGGGHFVAETDFTAVAYVDGLEPETTYGYRASVSGRPCSDDFTFTTLRAAGSSGRLRFVTAGDINGDDIPGFDDIASVAAQFVVMLGDNVYADGFGETLDVYRQRYRRVFGGAQLAALFAHTPAFAMWDDHELVDNYWEGKNDDVYAFARPLFEHYQGSRNPDPVDDGELYYSFEAGEVGFFVLDTRSHRAPNGDPDGPEKSMLGAEQKAALLAWIADNRYRVHVIVSSVLMSDYTTTGSDSWRAFATEREEILGAIADHGTSNTLVLSGDQHWSAVLQLERAGPEPYTIFEFQTTPLGFDERGAPSDPDASVLALDNTHRVFGVFDIDTTREPPTLDFTLCAVGSPCTPHDEPAPVTSGSRTSVPYSIRLEGGDRGFRLTTPL